MRDKNYSYKDKKKRTKENEARTNTHSKGSLIYPTLSEDELIEKIQFNSSAIVLILDCIQDPRNLGACLRTADAVGAIGVIAPKDKSSKITETVAQVSCGGSESVPYVQVVNLSRTIKKLQKAGMWIVGTSDQGDECIYNINLKGKIAIALGAEGKGLRRLTIENCDHLVSIPMSGKVDCLNVSVAAGVCLFEIYRQNNL